MSHAGILLALTVATGPCRAGAIGNGALTSTARPVAGFSRIEAAGSGDVHVRQGSAFVVTVTTDSNLQRLIETRVQGDRLIIDEHDVASATELRVDIQLPALAGATLSGSGTLEVSVTSVHDVDLVLSGSGTLTSTGPAAAVKATLSGSGIVALAGSADALAASLSGSGQLDARHLTAKQARLTLTGSGDVQATVVQSVSLQIEGSGNIDWWGPAAVSSSAIDGSGAVTHHPGQ